MNPRIYEKIQSLLKLTEEKKADKSEKNELKRFVAARINSHFTNFFNEVIDRPSVAATKKSPFALALSNDESKGVIDAKKTVINSIEALDGAIKELKNEINFRARVRRINVSSETKELIQQAEELTKMLKKEYVEKFKAVIEPAAPKYIPKPPELSRDEKYTLEAQNMIRHQKTRLEKLEKKREGEESEPPPRRRLK